MLQCLNERLEEYGEVKNYKEYITDFLGGYAKYIQYELFGGIE